jgi:hypothetical protein
MTNMKMEIEGHRDDGKKISELEVVLDDVKAERDLLLRQL